MHMLSDVEIERLKTDSNFTISHLAFCLSAEKEKNKQLSGCVEEAVAWVKKVPGRHSGAEIANKWLQVLTGA